MHGPFLLGIIAGLLGGERRRGRTDPAHEKWLRARERFLEKHGDISCTRNRYPAARDRGGSYYCGNGCPYFTGTDEESARLRQHLANGELDKYGYIIARKRDPHEAPPSHYHISRWSDDKGLTVGTILPNDNSPAAIEWRRALLARELDEFGQPITKIG